MKDLEKSNELILLYELYRELLTTKQREYFELYFFDDYSLSEIAELKNVSRNVVYDSLVKITNALHKFENNLQLGYKQYQLGIIYQKFENIKECAGLIKKLKKLIVIKEKLKWIF